MSKLDEAKINLKSSLDRLEKVLLKTQQQVDEVQSKQQNLALNEQFEEQQKQLEEKEAKIRETAEEINYLRELNHKLQAKIGIEQERATKLQTKNIEAAKQIDGIIGEVQNYLSIN